MATSISAKTVYTVKIDDVGQLEDSAYREASNKVGLSYTYQGSDHQYVSQSYDAGQYVYTFEVTE